MAKPRLDKTKFLDRYRVGVVFLERYERRKASGDVTIVLERAKGLHLEEMAQVEEAINAVRYEPYKNILYARYISLLDYYTIGKQVNQTPQTVQRRIYRALKYIEIPEGVQV